MTIYINLETRLSACHTTKKAVQRPSRNNYRDGLRLFEGSPADRVVGVAHNCYQSLERLPKYL